MGVGGKLRWLVSVITLEVPVQVLKSTVVGEYTLSNALYSAKVA